MNIKLNIDGVDFTVTPVVTPIPSPLVPTVPVVAPTAPAGLLLIPSGIAATVVKLDALGWVGEHDGATNGTGAGVTKYPLVVGGRANVRSFSNTYTNYGGFRYHVEYDKDTAHTHFVYAGDLYFDSVAGLGQMELDNNQVTSDGKTYIFGVQCNSNDGAWDITKQDTQCHWIPSSAKGNPKNFPLNTWLHFEIASHRDDVGNITYDSVHFNGATQKINTTLPSARNLGWGLGACLVNFQLGGTGVSGSIVAYANNLQVAKW
jgi:hypothetical protein